MEQIIYNNSILEKHSIYNKCHNFLQNVSDRDYPQKYIFNSDIECLDIDTFEKKCHPKQAKKTVDAVIGICSCRNDKSVSKERLLLIEFRMNYTTTNNLSVTELKNKVNETKNILSYEININNEYYFIFNNNVIKQFKGWFSRKGNEKKYFKNYIPWSVDEFNNNILSIDAIPYKPIYSHEQISSEILTCVDNKDWEKYIKLIRKWLNTSSKYKYSNINEFNNIKEAILKYWDMIKPDDIILNENEELDYIILEEDINSILKNN